MPKPELFEPSNALAVQQPQAMTAPTPMHLLEMAMSQQADVDKLTKLMELQERWEANEARKAFLVAFAAFKAEAVSISRNIAVTAGPLAGKRYADLFSVVSNITPALSKHGLSLSWKLTKDEPQWLEVTCTVRHIQGHGESVSMGGPPDTGGAKNAIQARASAKTYLERYTALAITGMAAQGEDLDGKPQNGNTLPDEQFIPLQEAIQSARNLVELKAAFKQAYSAAKTADDQKTFVNLYEARKKGML